MQHGISPVYIMAKHGQSRAKTHKTGCSSIDLSTSLCVGRSTTVSRIENGKKVSVQSISDTIVY